LYLTTGPNVSTSTNGDASFKQPPQFVFLICGLQLHFGCKLAGSYCCSRVPEAMDNSKEGLWLTNQQVQSLAVFSMCVCLSPVIEAPLILDLLLC
jgi:hypothetical protein